MKCLNTWVPTAKLSYLVCDWRLVQLRGDAGAGSTHDTGAIWLS